MPIKPKSEVSAVTTGTAWLQQPTTWSGGYTYPTAYTYPAAKDYANVLVVDHHEHDVTLRFRRQNGRQLDDVATITVPKSLFDKLKEGK